MARGNDGKPYPHSCCSWKVTYFNKSFFLGSLIGNQQRYEVKTLGPNSSALIIRDYQSDRDDGIYRCFATRLEGAMKEFQGFVVTLFVNTKWNYILVN